jgi:predicted TPR repeat methyltransferase
MDDDADPAATLNERATQALTEGNLDAAIALYQRALEHDPTEATILYNLANTYYADNNPRLAVRYYRQALRHGGHDTAVHYNYAHVLEHTGHPLRAAWQYWQLLQHDPSCVAAAYRLRILTHRAPPCAPLPYVEQLFNGYAATYNASLLDNLQYQGTSTLFRLLKPHLPGGKTATVLDIGCGTGLMGQALSPVVAAIDGVDVAAAMLEQARESGVYRALYQQDILSFLPNKDGLYDVVVSADCFPYIGALESLFSALSRVLVPGGLLAFTTEAYERWSVSRRGWKVTRPGRYQHRQRFVLRTAAANAFQPHQTSPLRWEGERYLNGEFYVFQLVR